MWQASVLRAVANMGKGTGLVEVSATESEPLGVQAVMDGVGRLSEWRRKRCRLTRMPESLSIRDANAHDLARIGDVDSTGGVGHDQTAGVAAEQEPVHGRDEGACDAASPPGFDTWELAANAGSPTAMV